MPRSPLDRLVPSEYAGRIAGSFELHGDDLDRVIVDTPVIAAVVLIPKGGGRKGKSNGDTVETIQFEARELIIIQDNNLRETILNQFPTIETALPFPIITPGPSVAAIIPPDVDEDTGEVFRPGSDDAPSAAPVLKSVPPPGSPKVPDAVFNEFLNT